MSTDESARSIQVIVHLTNTDPFMADMEMMPPADATFIYVTNPRTREGKNVPWDAGGTRGFIFPFSRVSFIELLVDRNAAYTLEPFFRDNTKK